MKLSKLLWGAALVAGVLAAPAIALPAAPAHAVTATRLVSNQSANNSVSPKTVTVTCPSDAPFLYGPGGGISGGGATISLQEITPVGNPPTQARVSAAEVDSNFNGNWRVSVFAICGPFTTDLQVVTDTNGPNTEGFKVTEAECPDGLGLYGTGFRISDANNSVFNSDILIQDVFPIPQPNNPTSVGVRSFGTSLFLPSYKLEAFGICAVPAPTMRVVRAQSALNSSTTKGVTTDLCPNVVPGTVAHGVGVRIRGPQDGPEVNGRIGLTTLAALFTTSGSAGAEEYDEFAPVIANWRLTAYVICAN